MVCIGFGLGRVGNCVILGEVGVARGLDALGGSDESCQEATGLGKSVENMVNIFGIDLKLAGSEREADAVFNVRLLAGGEMFAKARIERAVAKILCPLLDGLEKTSSVAVKFL